MSLYDKWTNMVTEFVKTKGEVAFWDEYKNVELKIYSDILKNKNFNFVCSILELSNKYDVDQNFIVGFIDGINDSLEISIDLQSVGIEDDLEFKIDVEKLYFNMLDAKADYLYNLKEWEFILSKEKINDITVNWRKSKVIVNTLKIGRNDLCICGSGKKYKNCCGR